MYTITKFIFTLWIFNHSLMRISTLKFLLSIINYYLRSKQLSWVNKYLDNKLQLLLQTYAADIFFAQTWKDNRLRLPENMTSEYRYMNSLIAYAIHVHKSICWFRHLSSFFIQNIFVAFINMYILFSYLKNLTNYKLFISFI